MHPQPEREVFGKSVSLYIFSTRTMAGGRLSIEQRQFIVESKIKTSSNVQNISISRISCATGLQKTSVHSILKKDLKFKPYKPRVTHELREGDDMRRLEFCNRIEQLVNDGRRT